VRTKEGKAIGALLGPACEKEGRPLK